MNETDLLHHFILRAPLEIPHLWRIERRNIINVETVHGARVRNGVKGQCDAFALTRRGLHIEIETKAARGVLALDQLRWRSACAAAGVPHLVLRARRDEKPEETVTRWIDELRAVVEAS
jgi:hypothetical protein